MELLQSCTKPSMYLWISWKVVLVKCYFRDENSEWKQEYRQTSNTSHTLVGNKLVDHSDVVGASPVGSNYIFILNLTPGFNGLGKDNYKMRRETFDFWDLVCLISEVWQYISILIIYWGMNKMANSLQVYELSRKIFRFKLKCHLQNGGHLSWHQCVTAIQHILG